VQQRLKQMLRLPRGFALLDAEALEFSYDSRKLLLKP